MTLIHHIYLACVDENGESFQATWGRSGSLTQWIVKYGYVPIVLIGMVALAIGIGVGEWKSGGTIVAEAPSSVVAETVVERRPPTVEYNVEHTTRLRVVAFNYGAR